MEEYTLKLTNLELAAMYSVVKEYRREHGYCNSPFSDETMRVMEKIKELYYGSEEQESNE